MDKIENIQRKWAMRRDGVRSITSDMVCAARSARKKKQLYGNTLVAFSFSFRANTLHILFSSLFPLAFFSVLLIIFYHRIGFSVAKLLPCYLIA